MDIKDKIEHSKFLISRLDSQYDMANNKASFFIGFFTFQLGGVIALLGCNVIDNYIKGIIFLMTVFSIWGLIITIGVLKPYTQYNDKNKPKSLCACGSIAKLSLRDFIERSNSSSKDLILDDLLTQVHLLSSGITYKFDKLNELVRVILLEVVILLVPLTLIYLNR